MCLHNPYNLSSFLPFHIPFNMASFPVTSYNVASAIKEITDLYATTVKPEMSLIDRIAYTCQVATKCSDANYRVIFLLRGKFIADLINSLNKLQENLDLEYATNPAHGFRYDSTYDTYTSLIAYALRKLDYHPSMDVDSWFDGTNSDGTFQCKIDSLGGFIAISMTPHGDDRLPEYYDSLKEWMTVSELSEEDLTAHYILTDEICNCGNWSCEKDCGVLSCGCIDICRRRCERRWL